jgi:hypothetical protein
LTWAAIQSVLPYIPVSFQGRFAAGWHAALSMLAALGLARLAKHFPTQHRQRVRNIGVILTVPSTLLIVLAGPYMAIAEGGYPFYLPRAELRAVDWLAERVDREDVVLASYAIGNTMPTRASCRVFVGHQFGSYQLEDKLGAVRAFLDADTPDAERMAVLREYGVTWFYYGRVERQIGDYDPSQASFLEQSYEQDGVTVYRVRRDVLSGMLNTPQGSLDGPLFQIGEQSGQVVKV